MLKRTALVLAAAAIAFTCGGAAAGSSSTARLFWGAYVGGAQHGFADAPWDMRSARALEARLGKRLSLIEWGQDWFECSTDRGCGLRPFRADLLSKVRAQGAIPVLSWGSYVEGVGATQPDYSLAQIISGRYDSFIRDWAIGAKAWGHPFFLRFDWEMNTNSVPYSEHANGNRPGEFVQMWRHVHAIFDRVHAGNVTWVWCPNVEYAGSVQPLSGLYPGDAYVDWTCLDGYNWGTRPARPQGWQSFARVFGPTYRLLASSIAPRKPVMIGETASTEAGGSKAAWIAAALAKLPRNFPRVKALVWFDKSADGMDWPVGTSRAAIGAFARGIRSPRYAGGTFARLSTSPIRPLR
jgi:hypothetical protein